LEGPTRAAHVPTETEPLLRHHSSNPTIGFTSRSHSYPGGMRNSMFQTELEQTLPTVVEPEPEEEQVIGGWKSYWNYFQSYLLSTSSVIILIWVLRVTTLLLTMYLFLISDTTRLGDSVGPKEFDSWPILQTIGATIQVIPLIYHVFVIVVTPALPLPNSRSSRLYGPSATSKSILVISCWATLLFWFEPSLVHRLLEIITHPSNESTCIIFPYWWVDRNGTMTLSKILPAHGWASTMDLFQWIAGLGGYGIFYFMKQEYTRNMEVNIVD
jgi:hypothetical protein